MKHLFVLLAWSTAAATAHADTFDFEIAAGVGPCRASGNVETCDRIELEKFNVTFNTKKGGVWQQELKGKNFATPYSFYATVTLRQKNESFLLDIFLNDYNNGTPHGAARATAAKPTSIEKLQVQSGFVRLNATEAYRAVVTVAPKGSAGN